MLSTKIYPWCQDTYGWGEHKQFCSSCTFNAFGLLAGRVQHGSDYFQKVMEDEELPKAICVQGVMGEEQGEGEERGEWEEHRNREAANCRGS